MRHSYYIDIMKKDDAVLDELLVLVMRQARISSRRRTLEWDMRLDQSHLRVRFYLKGNYDDFVDAFAKKNWDFLERNGFIDAETVSGPPPAVSTFNWHGYIDRLAASSRRQ